MTTIAYDGRYIVADGRESMGNTISSDDANKFYLIGGNIFILCGKAAMCEQFANEFNAGKKPTDSKMDNGGFMFDGEKVFICFVDEDEKEFAMVDFTNRYWADGSGRDWAIAAMDHGKSAIDAVKYAITRDRWSGGTIRCYDTKTKKFIKVKQ